MFFAIQPCELAVSTSIAAAAGVDARDKHRKTVFVDYAAGALGTIQVQISANGTTWHNKGAPLTASGFVDIPEACIHVRLNTTVAITVAAVTAVLLGY